MNLPPLRYNISPGIRRIVEFKGYNTNHVIADGDMRVMQNLSCDAYPCLSQRQPRGMYNESFTAPETLYYKSGVLYVVDKDGDGYGLYAGEKDAKVCTLSDALPKQVVGIQNKLVIYPDKLIYNTDTHSVSNIDASYTISSINCTGQVVFDHGSIKFTQLTPNTLQLKSADSVVIKGSSKPGNNKQAILKNITHTNTEVTLTFDDNTFESVTENIISTTNIIIARESYDMDFIMESNNRLWGCKGSSIYASKLGDPTNWKYYKGSSVDSYAVTVGTDGDFTGLANYSGHLIFFKSGVMHKLYGNRPSNYQIVDIACHGLKKGCQRSVQVVNDVVFYLSNLGIMAYAGGVPEHVSPNLNAQYVKAAAGTDLRKYYISATTAYGDTDFLSYDISKGFWMREDDTKATDFALGSGDLYYIEKGDIRTCVYQEGDAISPEGEDIEWYCEFGPYHEYFEGAKIYSKLHIRLKLNPQSEVSISVRRDNEDYKMLHHIVAETNRSVYLPMIPQRCDEFTVRLEGKGRCLIESISREYSEGGKR